MAVELPHYEYQFEIETILTQFIALIDDAIVMRYDKNHQTGERILRSEIKPHYVFGPKTRILYQLVNKAKNYTLPLVSISLKGIKADKERMTDKLNRISRYYDGEVEGYARPTPITIDLQVTIITKLMTDMYQLYGKLATQFQPYCVYSWAVPSDSKFSYEELRNKVEWDMNISLDARDKVTEADEDKFTGSMNFSVQGWLFPENKACEGGIILDIGSTVMPSVDVQQRIEGLNAETLERELVDVYEKEMGEPYLNKREFANARPRILKGSVVKKLGKAQYYFSIKNSEGEVRMSKGKHKLHLNGYNFNEETEVMVLCPKNKRLTQEYRTVNFKDSYLWHPQGTLDKKKNTIAGYIVKPIEQTQNNLTIDLSEFNYTGDIDIVVFNKVDYDAVSFVIGKKIQLGE